MTSVSGGFFKGLAQLLDTLLKAVSQFREIIDQKHRRETVRDILAACLVANEIVRMGRLCSSLQDRSLFAR